MTIKGIVAGSFDPITVGHLWVITEALKLVDTLYVVIGHNPGKPGYFNHDERMNQVRVILNQSLPDRDRLRVHTGVCEGLLINYAKDIGVNIIVRGIRNSSDFLYEQQIQAINANINPDIRTVYLIPPNKYLEVSSSVVRGLVGFEGWQRAVQPYVHPYIIKELELKHKYLNR